MKKIIVSALIITSTMVACKTAEKPGWAAAPAKTTPAPAPLPAGTLTFATDIKPIMEQYCTRCHNTNEKAGYNFSELSFARKAGANGELLGSIKHLDGFDPMPAYADKMDDATIAKIETWIKTGMN